MAGWILRGIVAFLPVLVFLGALIYLDSYKLVRFGDVIKTIVVGGLVAGLSYWANLALVDGMHLSMTALTRYVAPPVEELLKAAMVIWLIRTHRVGFLVDSAIVGFAVGAGFAVVENAYYMQAMPEASIAVWVLRGFGTAVMHGGSTALVGIVVKSVSDSTATRVAAGLTVGLLLAIAVHSAFNHFFFHPVFSTLMVLTVLPPLIFAAFRRSEQALREWLNVGFDADTELLALINSGGLSASPVGNYLQSLKERFRGEVVADMLCYLRLHVELALRAKGLLMMREAGFAAAPDEETRETFKELDYLEDSIGHTGRLAMAPFVRVSGKELWQLYMLK